MVDEDANRVRPEPRRKASGDQRQPECEGFAHERPVGDMQGEFHILARQQPDQHQCLRDAVAEQRRLGCCRDEHDGEKAERETGDRAGRLRQRIVENVVTRAGALAKVLREATRHDVERGSRRQSERYVIGDESKREQRRGDLCDGCPRQDRGLGAAIARIVAGGVVADVANRVLRPPGEAEQKDEVLARQGHR